MAKDKLTGPSGQGRQLFARRQVYLRAGQDSQYVELSPLLQIGVAVGFGVLALWLIGASHAALTGSSGDAADAALLAKLSDVEQERDAALADADRIIELETALVEAETRAGETEAADQTETLASELEQAREEADDLRNRLSEARADQVSLQAKLDAETIAITNGGDDASEDLEGMQVRLEDAFVQIATLRQERDAAMLNLAERNEESIAKDEATQRNTDLLATATAEIKRLRNDLVQAEANGQSEADELALTELATERDEAIAERDDIERDLAALSSELEGKLFASLTADDDANRRNNDLLRAATTEIERLQTDLVNVRAEASQGREGYQTTIDELGERLNETVAERDDLAREMAAIDTELEEAREASLARQSERASQESNGALLRAATNRIEALQDRLARVESAAGDENDEYRAEIDELEGKLDEALAIRTDLEREVADLNAELEEIRQDASADGASVTDEADFEALSIAAGLKEADLMATIEDLRAELENATAGTAEATPAEDDEEVRSLRVRLAIAEAEIERLVLAGLKTSPEPSDAPAEPEVEPEDSERLRAELLTAKADIIKLNADVKAAKQRLAAKGDLENGQAAQPGNFARLQQQLASTRSRMQQLNRALADAKLREVAIDLALINVVPSPSPPAPR